MNKADGVRHRQVEQELHLAQVAIDKSKSAFFRLSPEGAVTYVNEYACQTLGYSRDELLGRYVWEFDPDVTARDWPSLWERIRGSGVVTLETRHRKKDGSVFPVEATGSYICADGHEYCFAFAQDITDRKRLERELQLAHAAINKSKNAFFWVSPHGQVTDANDFACRSLGYTREELIGLYVWDFDPDFRPEAQAPFWADIKRDGIWILESRHRRKDGTIFPVEVIANYIESGGEERVFCSVQDISERKAAEQERYRLAFLDHLTDLPNRRLLMDRLRQALAISARNGIHGAVMFIDLDHFKNLNDTRGHDVGDMLLVEVAKRLQSSVRLGDTVARLGGDEFVVMLNELHADYERAAEIAGAVAEKIRQTLHRPYVLQRHTYDNSSSIGISVFVGNRDTPEDLLRKSDTAMYEAKRAGRNAVRFFDPVMQRALERRARLESGMRQALSQDEFSLHYQVQIDKHGRRIGAEALLRWQHPEEGSISPEQFIPVAEETGLIMPIGQWVLETACARIKAWDRGRHTCALALAVNVSAYQFRQPEFVDQVKAAIERSGIDPARLKLELTESLVVSNIEDTIAKMLALKLVGVRFSMDDFGTGHSSLSYLKLLPLDQLKIDRSFVRDIVTDPSDAVIVQTIISMGRTLGLSVIAEGVETEEQRRILIQHGCEAFQGYLFGRPVPAAEFERTLAAA
jgi:diguanylate cyclase (GGDEF)-like protein/PAS domain S-box-containing protein